MKESSLKRLFKFVLAHWPFLILSTLAAFLFVIFNSASIWITATMINNILIDFNETPCFMMLADRPKTGVTCYSHSKRAIQAVSKYMS